MQTTTERPAKEIKIGDMLRLVGEDCRVIALRPYRGSLEWLWPEGAQIASLDRNGREITLEPQCRYTVIAA